MKITYINHSGFLAETNQALLLFDFAGGILPPLDPAKTLVVFVSHRHEDHFNPDIFTLADSHPHTVYVLSDDIWQNRVPEKHFSRTHFIDPGRMIHLAEGGGILIHTFRSTDEGVAFLVEAGGKTIFHAGDLNDWQWNGESLSWNHTMKANYQKELETIHRLGIIPDAAMVPLDGRQEDLFYLGLHEFMCQVGAGMVFPMHFWNDFSVIDRLKSLECSDSYRDKIAEIQTEGQSFEI